MIMDISVLAILTVIFVNLSHSFGHHQCCDECNYSSCCSTCQTSCQTSRCINTCQKSCCPQGPTECRIKDGDRDIERYVSPGVIVVTAAPGIVGGGGGTANNTLTANVHSSNIITNRNDINLNIIVSNDVVNNVEGDRGGDGKNQSKPVPIPVPVKVPCPKCPNGQQPTPTTSQPPVTPVTPVRPTLPVPRPNCCVIIVPCATPNCNPYHHMCHDCRGRYGYLPINPCGDGGCYKRSIWQRQRCSLGQCVSRNVDCSYCQDDFYTTFSGYSQCHGCFSH